MTSLRDSLAWALRALSKLFTLVLLGAFVLGLLLLGVTVALLSVLWSLLRGKRPAMFTVFQAFRQASRPFERRAAGGPWVAPSGSPDEVVDVQAHEVKEVLPGHDTRPRP